MRQEDFIEQIKKARLEIDALKAKQFTGSSNVKIQLSESDNDWDINQNITLTTAFNDGFREIIGRFLANTQIAPFAQFKYDIYIDNIRYDSLSQTIIQDQGAWNIESDSQSEEQNSRTATNVLYLSYPVSELPKTINLKVKWHILSNDRGTISSEVRT